ncbi:zonadhesin [Acrasis kona]|uniref:Zonadhesin n=1 Tax=Acrasis kona TaxID=1008807 RepID=A0AAW2YRZ0_9EUKA
MNQFSFIQQDDKDDATFPFSLDATSTPPRKLFSKEDTPFKLDKMEQKEDNTNFFSLKAASAEASPIKFPSLNNESVSNPSTPVKATKRSLESTTPSSEFKQPKERPNKKTRVEQPTTPQQSKIQSSPKPIDRSSKPVPENKAPVFKLQPPAPTKTLPTTPITTPTKNNIKTTPTKPSTPAKQFTYPSTPVKINSTPKQVASNQPTTKPPQSTNKESSHSNANLQKTISEKIPPLKQSRPVDKAPRRIIDHGELDEIETRISTQISLAETKGDELGRNLMSMTEKIADYCEQLREISVKFRIANNKIVRLRNPILNDKIEEIRLKFESLDRLE